MHESMVPIYQRGRELLSWQRGLLKSNFPFPSGLMPKRPGRQPGGQEASRAEIKQLASMAMQRGELCLLGSVKRKFLNLHSYVLFLCQSVLNAEIVVPSFNLTEYSRALVLIRQRWHCLDRRNIYNSLRRCDLFICCQFQVVQPTAPLSND